MGIILIAAAYITVTGLFVAFFRFTNERDAAMHAALTKWIEETTQA